MKNILKTYPDIQPHSVKFTVETFKYKHDVFDMDIFLPVILIDRISDVYIISDNDYLRFDVWNIEFHTPNPPNGSINVYLKCESEAEAIKVKLKS